MKFEEIIQKLGRRIKSEVRYQNNNGNSIAVDKKNIERIKIAFNCPLIGSASKSFEIELKNKIEGAIYIKIIASYENYTAEKEYGPLYLKEIPEYQADKKTYVHTCYDYIIKTMINYEPVEITYPCTIKDYFDALLEKLNIINNIESLPNGELILDRDIYQGIDYTYRDVIDDIAVANGVLFETVGTELKIANPMNTEEVTINDKMLFNRNIEIGTKVGPINYITLSRSGESDNIFIFI
jgi:hypothetical protein